MVNLNNNSVSSVIYYGNTTTLVDEKSLHGENGWQNEVGATFLGAPSRSAARILALPPQHPVPQAHGERAAENNF